MAFGRVELRGCFVVLCSNYLCHFSYLWYFINNLIIKCKVTTGFNDLATLYPQFEKEWCYEKNEKKPFEYTAARLQSM